MRALQAGLACLVLCVAPCVCLEGAQFGALTAAIGASFPAGTNVNNVCDLEHVTCSSDGNDVVEIRLSATPVGALSSRLCDLPMLEALVLSDGSLSRGNIPDCIMSMDNLRELVLSRNPELGGPVPSPTKTLTFLQILNLPECSLTFVPVDLMSFTPQLQNLDLRGNQLEGTAPPPTGAEFLQFVDLSFNRLTGNICLYHQLEFLKGFRANGNLLSGAAPTFSSYVSESLRDLDVSANCYKAADAVCDTTFACTSLPQLSAEECTGASSLVACPNSVLIDDDLDGVPDASDVAPLDGNICGDLDNDGCDDCATFCDTCSAARSTNVFYYSPLDAAITNQPCDDCNLGPMFSGVQYYIVPSGNRYTPRQDCT